MLRIVNKSLPWLSFFSLLILWQGCAMLVSNAALPPPAQVFWVFIAAVQSGQLPHHLGITLCRLLVSFIVAMNLGVIIGYSLGRSETANRFFDHWVIIFLNIPALVTIILCYVWFGLNEMAALLAVVINKLPNVIIVIREGVRALDQELLAMAKCYRLRRWVVFKDVIFPQLHPFIMTATRSGLSLTWKIILVVELLGRSDGVGFQLHTFFQLFDVASILAYTIAFVAIVQVLEWGVLRPLDRRSVRWRR
jgi:NitT/TauT family transport system permease protein